MTTCGTCNTRYTGHRTEHCTGCHETFTGNRPGDMHRVGDHGVTEGDERRRCLTVEEMTERGMTRDARGAWTTGRVMPLGQLSVWGRNAEMPLATFPAQIRATNGGSEAPTSIPHPETSNETRPVAEFEVTP